MASQADLIPTLDSLSIKSPPEQPALTEFLLFPKLPTEIRLKIWDIILYAPRKITLKHLGKDELASENLAPSTEPVVTTDLADWRPLERRIQGVVRVEEDTNPAILLDINMESRMEALNFYDGKFPSHSFEGWEIIRGVEAQALWGSGRLISVSFAHTKFFLLTRHLLCLRSVLLQQIQNLELLVTDHPYFAFFAMDTLKLMSSLRNLKLSVRKGVINKWGDSIRGGWWKALMDDFNDEKLKDLEWDCPSVKIFDVETGEQVGEVEAGKGEIPEEINNIINNPDDVGIFVGGGI